MPELVGQFETRRGPGGRIERIPEAEQGELRAAAAGAPPLPPAPEDPFITRHREDGAEPPPLPPAPEVLPEEDGGAEAAAAGGAAAGFGGPAAAAAGAAGAWLLSKAMQQPARPIGTLEGGSVNQQDDLGRDLKDLLNVTKQVARIGTPIRGEIKTTAANSRM